MVSKTLPPGNYIGTILKVRTSKLNQLKLIFEIHEKTKHSAPTVGARKFWVTINYHMVYTVIGASNIHHAENKATLLWGPYWSNIYEKGPTTKNYKFVPIKEFNHLIKTPPNSAF